MKPPTVKEPASRDEAPTADEAAAGEGAPLYRDPFAGDGPCRLALAIPEEQRAAVTENCPRCGPRRDPLAAPQDATCLLEGLELDLIALDGAGADRDGSS